MDTDISGCPEIRINLVAMELENSDLHIAILSETRITQEGQLRTLYSLLERKEKRVEIRRTAGVAFAVKTILLEMFEKFLQSGLWAPRENAISTE